MPHLRLFPLWLASQAAASSSTVWSWLSLSRQLEQGDDASKPPSIWGYQQGAANGHTDAGGMVYDHKRDGLILVGTTYDNQFFNDPGANGIDCFIATILLPDIAEEVDEKEAAATGPELVGTAESERKPWTLSGKHRMATANRLDRCDLIASAWNDVYDNHDHTFVGGTFAVNQNANHEPTAVQPLLYETKIQNFVLDETVIETGPLLAMFETTPVGIAAMMHPSTVPKKNEIIIPSAMTVHGTDIYVATIHRVLVVSMAQIGTSTANPQMQISLGVARFKIVNNDTMPLVKTWSHILPTTMMEGKSNDVPHVTSSMFHPDHGINPAKSPQIEANSNAIEEEINEIEEEQAEYEAEAAHTESYRHEYQYDGVLVSAMEVVQTSNSQFYLLIAGSAPGTVAQQQGIHNNHTMTANHPFMPHSKGYTSNVGDWDGYVAKLDPKTGFVVQHNQDINTWGYRLHTEPKRNDFLQSMCVPKVQGGLLPNKEKYYPSVVYAVGTTQGIVSGTQYGGAFIVQLDLTSMSIKWKQQLPGMNVHGMACEVWVDTASHGTTISAESKDLLYIAGEVHGNMKVTLADGSIIQTHGNGETDVYVAQLRASDGKVNWVQQVGTNQQDRLAKNINNPAISDGELESDVGETGSGKGALVLDRLGNAIIYGTTNGSLGRTKTNGDRNRDIFVVRLHRGDGSYKAIVEPHSVITEHTPTPIGSGPGTSTMSPVPDTPVQAMESTNEEATYAAETDASANIGVIVAGFAVPVALGVFILLATYRQPSPSVDTSDTPMESDLSASPPSLVFPPKVEQSLEMSPTRHPPTTESFGIV